MFYQSSIKQLGVVVVDKWSEYFDTHEYMIYVKYLVYHCSYIGPENLQENLKILKRGR